MKFWIYIEKELIDLLPHFEKIFEVDNLYRDYENVYEWLESENRELKYYLNISRPHNWDKGEYDKPIIIIIEDNKQNPIDANKIADRIKGELNCDVFSGEIYYDSKDQPLIKTSNKH
jgi:hypothetical protein